MRLYGTVRSILLFSTCLVLVPAHAQQNAKPPSEPTIRQAVSQGPRIVEECESIGGKTTCRPAPQESLINGPRQSLPGPNMQSQRIVDECSTNGVNPCRQITMKTVTMQVPQFKPGDQDRHVYIVSSVHQAGCSGSGTAHPDEYGLIKEGVGASGAMADKESCQYHLVVVDKQTLESRITLDLYEVKLIPFMTSLEGAMHFGVGIATGDRFRPSRFFARWSNATREHGELRLSIRGDNLTIDELLDKVYQNTGCVINREAEGLMLASCPQTAR